MRPAAIESARHEIALLTLDGLLARDLGCVDDMPGSVRARAEAAVRAAVACAETLLAGGGVLNSEMHETAEQAK